MAEPETPEKPAKTSRAKVAARAAESPDPGINASVTGDLKARQEPDLGPGDPGINAGVVS